MTMTPPRQAACRERTIPDRAPVIIAEKADQSVSLGEEPGDYAARLRSAADGVLKAWKVSRATGYPKVDRPELLMSQDDGA